MDELERAQISQMISEQSGVPGCVWGIGMVATVIAVGLAYTALEIIRPGILEAALSIWLGG